MAVPPVLIAGLGQVAMNPKVQSFAGRLVKDVYGKIMPSKKAAETENQEGQEEISLENVAERLNELPTREELVTSFAFLQAELDRQNKRTRMFIVIGLAIQLTILVTTIMLVS